MTEARGGRMGPDEQTWFYLENGQQRGPCDLAALLTALRQGTIPARAHVWRPGMDAWTPAIEVRDIVSQLPPLPASTTPTEALSPVKVASPPSVPAAAAKAKPWPRYFARWFDIMFASLAVGAIVGVIVEFASPSPILQNNVVLGMLGLAVWAVVEGPILSQFGITPGKALLGIFVRTRDGRKPELADAFERSLRVWAAQHGA